MNEIIDPTTGKMVENRHLVYNEQTKDSIFCLPQNPCN